jgi:hypothetical protein
LAWNDHARCVEHGEWVEVEHPMAAPAPAQPARGPIVEAAGSIPRVHDHCSIFEASRARGIEWSGKLELSPLLSVERIASAPRSEPGDSPFALYLLAPKHSPPC